MEKLSSTSSWDSWVEEALSRLESLKLLRSLRPIELLSTDHPLSPSDRGDDDYEVFEGIRPWDRRAVEVSISMPTFQNWLLDIPSAGDEGVGGGDGVAGYEVAKYKKLLLFSGNDYLGLSSHPSIAKAAIKAAQEHGMGPRGSALICGYTNHHRLLESSLADLKKKEEKIAIFSDALNHASIIDGIRLAERQKAIELHIYRHCDMSHLSSLLATSKLKKKVVVTDGLFSMDGDFAPMIELVNLRKQHGFLLVIDDAHGTFVCGKYGGGVAEQFNCEKDVDICIGTLSKAAGCHGGFIACSKKWKLLIQSRGRSFIFSTASTVPVVAAAHAAVVVARKEVWRRRAIWNRVQEFRDLTGVPITSHVISLIVGNEEKALQASRHLLKSGFHVTAIRPPPVPPNSCWLRVALSAAHTEEDVKKLAAALSHCINLQDAGSQTLTAHARL